MMTKEEAILIAQEFIGVKIVKAVWMTDNEFREIAGRPTHVDGDVGGYMVIYPQVDPTKEPYLSWCPKAEFEKANRLTPGMPFGHAIEAAKHGKKVARRKWNGKDMFVVYMPPLQLPPHSSQEPGAKVNDRTAKFIGEDTPLDCQPYFAMFNAQKQWIPGWLASQSDMLDDDWYIVE